MKTFILKRSELDKLSRSSQEEILSIFRENENTIISLKERIKKLESNQIDYRSDNGKVVLDTTEDRENLEFNIWRKTNDEEWGNCSDAKYTVRLGKKYIRVDIVFSKTDNVDCFDSEYITNNKLSEILDLIEEAFDSVNKVDADKLISIACRRIQNIITPN